MYFDITYLYFVVPALIVSLWAQIKVKSAYSKYSKMPVARGVTGAAAARTVLDSNGLKYVRIERIAGVMTDHYDPKSDVVRLSADVYDRATAAAVGIACHEAGHAVQHAQEYLPSKIRTAIVPATRIGSSAAMILIPIGILLAVIGYYGAIVIAYIGIVAYSLCAVFQLVTLPTEFNASSRAMASIRQSGMFTEDEQRGARKVLTAAALTYVAALFATLMTLLRFIAIISRVSGNRRG